MSVSAARWVGVGAAIHVIDPTGGDAESAHDGVLVVPPPVKFSVWPEFADEPPRGDPLVLVAGDEGWTLDAARTAAALHAAGRRVVVVRATEEDADAAAWLAGIEAFQVRADLSAVAGLGGAERDLLISGGYLTAVLGLASLDVCPAAAIPPGGSDRPLLTFHSGDVGVDEARALAAARSARPRVLLVAREGSVDPADPWLAQVDLAIVTDDGAVGWREQGRPAPRWRSREEAEQERLELALAELEAATQARRAQEERQAEQAARDAAQAERERERRADEQARQAADRAVRERAERQAREEQERAEARRRAAAQAASPAGTGSTAASRPARPCPHCASLVTLPPHQSVTTCSHCGKTVALGECPECGHIGLAAVSGDRVRCQSCGYLSASGLPGAADKASNLGGKLVGAGCALSVLFWLGIPLLVLVIAVIYAVFNH